MKKFFLMLALAVMSIGMTVKAQTVESSRFFDNWSVGLKGGMTTPLTFSNFWHDTRAIVGLELTKDITPIFALGVDGSWTINTSNVGTFNTSNKLAFDRQYIGLLMKVNLMNAFKGYRGTPRTFEIDLVGGIGWQHDFVHRVMNEDGDNVRFAYNSWYTKWGADFNFNLGKSKAWSLSVKPAVVFDMLGGGNKPQFNKNFANFEVNASIAYHFKNHNGTHSFVICNKKYTQAEVDALNAEINNLRDRLKTCESREPEVIERIIIQEVKVTENNTEAVVVEFPPIAFGFDSDAISEEFEVTLEWMANELNKTNNNILISGFASNEGNEKYNVNLSLRRAEAVKNVLVKKGVNAERISVKGMGATTQFGTNQQLNRVVITNF